MSLEDKFGCIIFEDDYTHKEAWVSMDNDKEAQYVSGPNDLPSDVVWLTNLPYSISFQAGYFGHGRFRKYDYLKTSTQRLSEFLGLEGDYSKQAVVFASLFSRVLHLVDSYILKGQEFDDHDLKTAIRKIAGGVDFIYPEKFAKILDSALAYSVLCERQVYKEEKFDTIYLRCPPVEHARFVLSTPLPVGKWIKVSAPEEGQSCYDWLASQPAPVLVKVKYSWIKSEINAYLNFGSGSVKYSKRNWITGTELVSLLPVSDIEVIEAYRSETLTTCKPLLDMIDALPDVCELSLSVAILLDNLWAGIGTAHKTDLQKSVEKKARDKGHKRTPNRSINHISPFLRAQERLFCYHKALQIAGLGFDVLGYGAGCVRINKSGKSDEDILKLSSETGMIPPMMTLSKEECSAPNLKQYRGLLQYMYAQNMLDKILEADKKVVSKLMQQAKKGE